ncbi:hypothetical protein [Duganella sp. CY15W]|uniref:hypothetical protein n=1 Tax=Duganella sp. CY15W TaxID=2692172 RepID=UPI0019265684|nr:hypothetical protein [Duganella sp. CY15W]
MSDSAPITFEIPTKMIPILAPDSYRGFSAPIGGMLDGAEKAAQPIFIGRVLWPDGTDSEDAVIKLYETNSCGVANETIGYIVNALRGVRQPKRGGILLLSKRELPNLERDLSDFIDPNSGLAACWITSFEQNAQPFRYIRKLSSFSRKQSDAFYKSTFCVRLATVDHVTGNNDRHEGNFLYEDDLKYLAIDQGCVGGSRYWHTSWPDQNPRNELALLAQNFLNGSQLAKWRADAIMEYEKAQSSWDSILIQISSLLPGLLGNDEIDTIMDYMRGRAAGPAFAASCERLI